MSRLFKAYFQDGQDIGDRYVLLNIGEGIGMDRETLTRLYDSDADLSDIRASDEHARARGVTGVPTFVLANQHVLPGAQPTDLWLQVIDEIAEQLENAG